ncbi:MAG: hypothetical protein ACOX7F_02730 [Eubacteriales bacterium]|jgi:hypothetical protein
MKRILRPLSWDAWLAQGIFFLTVLCYLYFFWDGGFFTTYYSVMAVLLAGVLTGGYLAFRRRWACLLVNLTVALLIFAHFLHFLL